MSRRTRASSRPGSTSAAEPIVDLFTNSPAFVNHDRRAAGRPRHRARHVGVSPVPRRREDRARSGGPGELRRSPDREHAAEPARHRHQAPKSILTQMANCDQTVPNPFNLIYASNVPTGPEPTGASFFAPGATGTFQLFVGPGFNPATFGTCSPLPGFRGRARVHHRLDHARAHHQSAERHRELRPV